MRRSTRNIPPLPPGKFLAFELLKIGSFQIPAPSGQSGVQIPYLVDGFFCQISLLNNNRRRFLSSIKTCSYACQHMSHDPIHDDGVFTRLELLQKDNLNIKTIKNDLKLN